MKQFLQLPPGAYRIGCLGLSANPPHNGHLMIARDVLASGLVDFVLLIPVLQHAFLKQGMAPWEDRLAMLQLLVAGEENMMVCTIERELGGISYTCKTLAALYERYPSYEFHWIIGGDIINTGDFRRWKNWEQLERAAKFIVVPRLGYWFYAFGLPSCFRALPYNVFDERYEAKLSSTMVRDMIRNGEDATKAVGPEVAEYIREHNLYQKKKEE